ncbi:MAG: DUF2088 domain-containing protein [Proteobacteria bacterium]|nr:DUF2088 domain-containing protein [Pseudomonadota bacterium]
MDEQIVFGDRMIPVRLPDQTRFAPSGLAGTPLPAVDDLTAAVREALAAPLDMPPIRETAEPGWKVTIAFDDPTVPMFAPVWETAIRLVLDELDAAGVKRGNVSLVCANALHRKFTRLELARVIGKSLVEEFGYRLDCHDAEDPDNLEYLGVTESGYDVEVNRCLTESDLTVYVNTALIRAFSGGWKSICVGLSTYRSIRWHHSPDGMSMSIDRNPMHDMLNEMGAHLESRIGRDRIFKIETMPANPFEVARVWAGSVWETRSAALGMLKERFKPRAEMDGEKADVVLYGIPDWSPYASFSTMNPILTLVSTGLGYLGGVIEALGKPGCSVIMASPVKEQWNDVHHPSYREIWEKVLPQTRDPYEIQDRFAEDFAHRPDYIYKYRYACGFHPIHGIMATYPLKRLRHASRVIVAGAEEPGLVRHLGFDYAPTVEAAVEAARDIHGRDASIVFVKYPVMGNR